MINSAYKQIRTKRLRVFLYNPCIHQNFHLPAYIHCIHKCAFCVWCALSASFTFVLRIYLANAVWPYATDESLKEV